MKNPLAPAEFGPQCVSSTTPSMTTPAWNYWVPFFIYFFILFIFFWCELDFLVPDVAWDSNYFILLLKTVKNLYTVATFVFFLSPPKWSYKVIRTMAMMLHNMWLSLKRISHDPMKYTKQLREVREQLEVSRIRRYFTKVSFQ